MQEPVEVHEVVHVAVADEDVGHPQALARCQRPQVAPIERQGTALEHPIDGQGRVAERVVDQLRQETRAHQGVVSRKSSAQASTGCRRGGSSRVASLAFTQRHSWCSGRPSSGEMGRCMLTWSVFAK